MDENAKRMMEQLKADPAALRQLMQSRDGQALMQALTRPDNGAGPCRLPCAGIRMSWRNWWAGWPKARRARL